MASKSAKLRMDAATKQQYLAKYSASIKSKNKNTPSYAQWLNGKERVYFKGITRESPEARMRAAGINWEEDKPTAKLKRNKK